MKKFTKIIALILAVTLIVPAYSFGAESKVAITGEIATKITFGSYPQREVVSQVSQSGVNGKSWQKKDAYIVDSELYTQLQEAEWDENNNAIVNDEKYYRVLKENATNVVTGDNYYSWADDSTYHYFKYEPIKWRILQKNGNEVVLLADIALDAQKYNSNQTSITWGSSSLRNWLNNNFYNMAFTADEQSAINTATNENKDSLTYGTEGGNDTNDKVFVLSESEVYTDNALKYGFESAYNPSTARQMKSSTYAKAMGVKTEKDGYTSWILRSPGVEGDCAAHVYSTGQVLRSGDEVTNCYSIVPAIHLNLDYDDLYTIQKQKVSITQDDISLLTTNFEFDGEAKEPKVVISNVPYGSIDLEYEDNINPGTAKALIKGTGDLSGEITKTFTITVKENEGSLAQDVNFDTIEFGTYPQREVVSLESQSGVNGKVWATSDDYIVDSTLYGQLVNAKWDENGDTQINGEKYHKVTKEDATYYSSKASDYYYNWSTENATHYFKYEPIKWRIIEQTSTRAMLLCDKAIDTKKYNPYRTGISLTWATSQLREWLNTDFFNMAFSETEQGSIRDDITLTNSNNLTYGTKGGVKTKDKVCLLSESNLYGADLNKYGIEGAASLYNKARQMKSSTYAKAMGISSSIYGNYVGNCQWWLRSPGKENVIEDEKIPTAVCVKSMGSVNVEGLNVYTPTIGVVPVIYVKTDKLPAVTGNTGSLGTKKIKDASISKNVYLYRKAAIEPEVTVKGLVEGKDYKVTYKDNNKAGLGKVIVSGIGNCSGTITLYFAIVETIDISNKTVTMDKTKYCYCGEAVCPEVEVEGLVRDVDYTVSYTNNEAVGNATLTVEGKDGYVGTIEKKFYIVDHKIEIRNAVKATYLAGGYTGDEYCKTCGELISQGTETDQLPQQTQTITTSKKSYTYKVSALKKNAVTFSLEAKASGKGKLTYKVTKGTSKNITVSTAGKVTLKKGCVKGTYKVTITAAQTKNGRYLKATKVVTITVK